MTHTKAPLVADSPIEILGTFEGENVQPLEEWLAGIEAAPTIELPEPASDYPEEERAAGAA